MVNKKTIECLCLGTIGLIVATWKFDVLKSSMFDFASLLGKIFVLRFCLSLKFKLTICRKIIGSHYLLISIRILLKQLDSS